MTTDTATLSAVVYPECARAALAITRVFGDESLDADIPRSGEVEAIVHRVVQRHGDLAYLGVISALTRMAVAGFAGVASWRGVEFEELLTEFGSRTIAEHATAPDSDSI